MKDGKRARSEARKLVHLVQHAIDDGAKSVEEIHRAIAARPLDVLERLDVFEETVKDVRKVQDASIGAVYDLIHKVNREVAALATELLRGGPAHKPAARKPAARRPVKTRTVSAPAR